MSVRERQRRLLTLAKGRTVHPEGEKGRSRGGYGIFAIWGDRRFGPAYTGDGPVN